MHTLIHTPKLLNIDGKRSFCYIWQVFEVDEADRKCIEVQKLFLSSYVQLIWVFVCVCVCGLVALSYMAMDGNGNCSK